MNPMKRIGRAFGAGQPVVPMVPMVPVVLVHGLWMPAGALWLLERRLARQGYRPQRFEYQGRSAFEAHVRALGAMLRAVGPVHVVAHSLGGLLVLETLNRYGDLEVSSAVLLGAPVQGSVSGRRLAAYRAGCWLLGGSSRLWHERAAPAWLHAAPVGVIAGSAPWGLGRLLGALPVPNDGVVCVDETFVQPMSDRMVLAINHSGMLFSSAVAAQIVAFLRCGRFDKS